MARQRESMVLWAIVAPTALTVLGRVSDVLDLSDFLAWLVRSWREVSHQLWGAAFEWLRQWIPIPLPSADQRDLLTFSLLVLSSSLVSLLVQGWRRPAGEGLQ